jgi:TonB-dependent starch-binding outer membrane protein SusC
MSGHRRFIYFVLRLSLLPLLAAGALSPARAAAQQEGRVTGRVTESGTQAPLAAVQVFLAGTQRGGVTGADGRYIITNVPAGSHEVTAERIGYRTTSHSVVVSAGVDAVVDFVLEEEPLRLDEVVVTGTPGAARRREVGNSIAQINLSSIAGTTNSVESLLQGRTPGVVVNFGGASMGQGAAIRLRGNVSLSQSNQPLIYVDGVRQTADAYPRNVSDGGSTFNAAQVQASPLSDINPDDIERIEIIKGAAAATLYGTEAATGVIQIFTKRGVPGRTTWNFSTDQGIDWIRPYGSDVRPLLNMEPWLKKAYGHKESLSLSGGAQQVQYFASGSFEDGDGVLPEDHQRRYSVRGNVTFHPLSTLSIDWNSFLSINDLAMSPDGNSGESIFFNVYRSPVTSLGEATKESIAQLLQRQTTQTDNRLLMGATARWLPLSWFSHRFTVGYDRASSNQEVFHPYGFVFQPTGDISEVNWQSQTVTLDYSSNADVNLTPDVRATLSAGGQLIHTQDARLDGFGRGLPGPGKQTLSRAAERSVFSSGTEVKTGGLFVQGLLALRNRYFLTGGLRVDGSSAFGSDFGLQAYPKVSASYVISDEPFWNDSWGTMKLRGAFGFAGRAPGVFDAVRTWNAGAFAGQTAFLPDNVGNPKLGPERTRELELGFDLATLHNRLSVELTRYDRRTLDALFNVQQPPSLGFVGSQLENVGELKANGFEISVNGTLIARPSFGLDLGATLTTNHSEVVSTGGTTSYNIVVGQPAPVIRGAKVVNKDAFEDPQYELDAFFGPSVPTRVINVFSTVHLPAGVLLTARGEYQGGAWNSDFPSRLVSQRGPVGAVGCDDVYKLVPWDAYDGPGSTGAKANPTNLDKVRALDRARCYKHARSDVWFMPMDFFKLREITARVPIPSNWIPRASSAAASITVKNYWRWVNSEFASFDPELIGSRANITALFSTITDQLPPPASLTFSLRVTF